MEMRTNAGYTITDSVHIGKAEFVIGEMPNAPAPFVTRQAAERDLLERAGQELEYQSRGQEQPEKKKKERER